MFDDPDNAVDVKDAAKTTFQDDEDYLADDADLGSGTGSDQDGSGNNEGALTTTLPPEQPVFPPGQGGDEGGEYPGEFHFQFWVYFYFHYWFYFRFQFWCWFHF